MALTISESNRPITIEKIDGKYKLFIHDTESGLVGTVSYFNTEEEAERWWDLNNPRSLPMIIREDSTSFPCIEPDPIRGKQ